MRFEQWLGTLLGQHSSEVERVLSDDTALHFLVAWSLFESKCFSGFVKIDQLRAYARRLVDDGFASPTVNAIARTWHERYQDKSRLGNLMHNQASAHFERLLNAHANALSSEDLWFVALVVVYRYRNNMFHGNKGVASWLVFKPQILQCVSVLQAFVSHEETLRPTMTTEAQVA